MSTTKSESAPRSRSCESFGTSPYIQTLCRAVAHFSCPGDARACASSSCYEVLFCLMLHVEYFEPPYTGRDSPFHDRADFVAQQSSTDRRQNRDSVLGYIRVFRQHDLV